MNVGKIHNSQSIDTHNIIKKCPAVAIIVSSDHNNFTYYDYWRVWSTSWHPLLGHAKKFFFRWNRPTQYFKTVQLQHQTSFVLTFVVVIVAICMKITRSRHHNEWLQVLSRSCQKWSDIVLSCSSCRETTKILCGQLNAWCTTCWHFD